MELSTMTDEELFDEWREIFTKCRNEGRAADHDRFMAVAAECANRGWFRSLR